MALVAEIMFWCEKSSRGSDVPGVYAYSANDSASNSFHDPTACYMQRRLVHSDKPQLQSNKKLRIRALNLDTLSEHLCQHHVLDFAWQSPLICDVRQRLQIILSNAELIRINLDPYNALQPVQIRAELLPIPLVSSYVTALNPSEPPAPQSNSTWFHSINSTTISTNTKPTALVGAKFSPRPHNILIGVLSSADIVCVDIEHWQLSLSLDKKLHFGAVQRLSVADCERNTQWGIMKPGHSPTSYAASPVADVESCSISVSQNATMVAAYMQNTADNYQQRSVADQASVARRITSTSDYVDPYNYQTSTITARRQNVVYVFSINDKSTAIAEKRALRLICKLYREWTPFSVAFSNVEPPEKLYVFERSTVGSCGECQARLSSFVISSENGGSSVRLNSMVLDLPGAVIASYKNPARDMWALCCSGVPLVLATFDPGANLLSSIELMGNDAGAGHDGLSSWQWLPCGSLLGTVAGRSGELKLYDFALQHVPTACTDSDHHTYAEHEASFSSSLRLTQLLTTQISNSSSADVVTDILWNPHPSTYSDMSAITVFKSGICGVLQLTWSAPKLNSFALANDLGVDSTLLFAQSKSSAVRSKRTSTPAHDFGGAVKQIVRQYLYCSAATGENKDVNHEDVLSRRRLAYQKIFNCLRRLNWSRPHDVQICWLLLNETFYSALRHEPFDMIEYNTCDLLLGLFYAPVQPHSESTLIKYAFQMRHLARMLTIRLLGVGKLELAYKLAHNMKDIDLIGTIRAVAAPQQQQNQQQMSFQENRQTHQLKQNFPLPRLLNGEMVSSPQFFSTSSRSALTRDSARNTQPLVSNVPDVLTQSITRSVIDSRTRRSSLHEADSPIMLPINPKPLNLPNSTMIRSTLHNSTEFLTGQHHFRTSSDASAKHAPATTALISPVNRRRPISFAPDSVIPLDDVPCVSSNV